MWLMNTWVLVPRFNNKDFSRLDIVILPAGGAIYTLQTQVAMKIDRWIRRGYDIGSRRRTEVIPHWDIFR